MTDLSFEGVGSKCEGQMTEPAQSAAADTGVSSNKQGASSFRLTPVKADLDDNTKRRVLQSVRASAAAKAAAQPGAARSQDFLYDDGGLPK
jgi:hypothetical protein